MVCAGRCVRTLRYVWKFEDLAAGRIVPGGEEGRREERKGGERSGEQMRGSEIVCREGD